MTNYTSGEDALNVLTASGGDNSFSKFGVGTTYKVRVLGVKDFITYVGYGNHKKGVHTFAAKNPSTRDKKGYATGNFTLWDLAEKHYRQQQFDALDADDKDKAKELGTLAGLYKGSPRFVMGFVNLENGDLLAIDVSKPQALAIHANISKYEKKLDKLAFELSKVNNGTRPQDTKVSLNPLIDFEDDLTDKEKATFRKFDGESFDLERFNGILFEADDDAQIESLEKAGFDISLIGATKSEASTEVDGGNNETAGADIAEEELPF